MPFPDDPGLVAVLQHFGVGPDAELGHGGEAWVYALDAARVLRVLHAGGTERDIRRRQALVDELARSAPAFALPGVIEIGELDGRIFAIERRLPGRSVMDELWRCEGAARVRVIEAHLDAAAALGDLHLEPRAGYGELIGDDAIVTPTWHGYLERRAATNLSRSTSDFHAIDAGALAAPFSEPTTAAFVHLDAFAGNMLTDGSRVTAVLDIGPTSVAGDRRLDPVSAAVYLASAEISPAANRADVDVATSWLRAHGLHDMFEPAQRWLAAFWSFAIDDPRVLRFCRAVLLEPR